MWLNLLLPCMSLHVETFGNGAPLLLLHGWGMHSGMWGNAVQKLAQHFTVHCLDLPGHGASGNIAPYPTRGQCNLDALVSSLSEYARQHFSGQMLTVCGWSLGGQIALHWAEHMPQQIQRLILVTSTPCFVQRADWLWAMPSATFQAFEQDLQTSPERTLKRFISLQVRGSEQERECLTHLRSNLLNRGQPDHSALRDGLAILRETDLRASLPHIKQPVLVLAGECDELTPALASEYLAQHLPNAKMVAIKGAAHVPFLSHTDTFLMRLKNFMDNK